MRLQKFIDKVCNIEEDYFRIYRIIREETVWYGVEWAGKWIGFSCPIDHIEWIENELAGSGYHVKPAIDIYMYQDDPLEPGMLIYKLIALKLQRNHDDKGVHVHR